MKYKNLRDVFWDTIYYAAKNDRNIVIVSADLGAISLDRFREEMPGQFVNTGIAEQNAITVAAGLALRGKRVFVYACAPFIHMRCYEQIRLTASGMHIPLTIIGQGAGFSFWEYGPTHHVLEDLGSMRLLPNMRVYAASDPEITEKLAAYSLSCDHASYIRMDKLAPPPLFTDGSELDIDKGFRAAGEKEGDVLLIGCGNVSHIVALAADELARQGISCGWLDMFSMNPEPTEFAKAMKHFKRVVTVEEHGIIGGLGSLASEVMCEYQVWRPLKRIACDAREGYWYQYGSRENVEHHYGLSVDNIVKTALTME